MDDRLEQYAFTDTPRVAALRGRVREAMERPAVEWDCPERIDDKYMSGPLAVRKARALGLKLAHMPADLWDGQTAPRIVKVLEEFLG